MSIDKLTETIAALRGRELQIPIDIKAAQDARGAIALAAAMSGDQTDLDAHDAKLVALEREAQTVAAAIAEADHAIRETKGRERIATARAAVKRLPATEKKVKAAYADLAKAIEGVTVALAKAKQAEQEANDLADEAVPRTPQSLQYDVYGRGRYEFSATEDVTRLVEQALTDPDAVRETVSERLASHIEAKVTAIAAESERRQQAIEQDMKDKRAGDKCDALAAHLNSTAWQKRAA